MGLALLILGASGPANATPEQAARYYEDALARYERGDTRGAIIQLKNTLQQDEQMLAAHLLLGKALGKDRDFAGAELAFNEALKHGVSRAEVAMPLGQVYLALGRPGAVIEKISASGLPNPLRVEVLSLRATAYVELGKGRLAAEAFDEARAADPKSAIPLIAEVPFLLASGQLEPAKAASERAVTLAPTNANAWNAKASVLHAALNLEGALVAYSRALSLDAAHVDARVARAALLIDANRASDAAKDLDFLATSVPDEPRAAYLRAIIISQKGDPLATKAALSTVVDLIKALPPARVARQEQVLMVGALAHHGLGNREGAREYLNLIVASNSRNTAARKLLASIYLDTREFSRAETILESLQKVIPGDPQLQFMLGSVRLSQKRYLEATELLEKAVAQTGAAEMTRSLALGQLGTGRTDLGLASLERTFAANPGDSLTGTILASYYVRHDQASKALKIAEAMVRADPANPTLLSFLGSTKWAAGDTAGARATFTAVLAKDPSFHPATLSLARLDASENRFDDGRRRLNALLAKRPDDANALYEFGLLEQRAGRVEEAIKYLQRANDVQARDPRPGMALIDVYLGQRQSADALASANALSSKYPANIQVLLTLARTQIVTGNLVGARSTLGKATQQVNYDAGFQVAIGRLQLAAANLDGAFYSARKALQGKPDDPAALALMVEIEERRGDRSKADAALKALTTKHPNRPESAIATAELAMSRGQYAAAVVAYRTALSREGTTANAINVARAHIAAGEASKAALFLEGWVKNRPNDLAALKALAETQFRAGQLDAARGNYARAVALAPDDSAMRNNYANLLLQLNNPAALTEAEETLRRSPNNTAYLDTLGWILVQKGELERGVRYLREARLRSPENGEIRFHLAYALARNGRIDEAKGELAAALNAPTRVTSTEALARLQKELGG